jgi:hypothetical protein
MPGTTEAVTFIIKLLCEGGIRKLGGNLADQLSTVPEQLAPLRDIILSRIPKDTQEDNFQEILERNLLGDKEYFQQVVSELENLGYSQEINIVKSPGAIAHNSGTVNQDFRGMSII